MQKSFVLIAIMYLFVIVSCKEDDKAFLFPKKGSVQSDEIHDTADTDEFRYQTLHDVSFDLQIYDDAKQPLDQAIIKVISEEGELTIAVTASNGTSAFKLSLGTMTEKLTLIIEHPSCKTETIGIENIQNISAIIRTIFLTREEAGGEQTGGGSEVQQGGGDRPPEESGDQQAGPQPRPDRDNDGVPDDSDEFPDDPFLIGTVNGEYTIAFEDNWPGKGDADFNDMVVRLKIREYIDNNNMVSKIDVVSKILAAGNGYKNQLWIAILDKDYELVSNPHQDLKGKWNTREKDKYADAPEHRLEIALSAPVARDAMDPMPYDPYIKCNGNDQNQVHLSFVKTRFKFNVVDEDNFPWAVLVPSDWAWPMEEVSILTAYPEFKPWYESRGADFKEWYLHPEMEYVFKISSGTTLTAYLMKVSMNINIRIVIAILAGVLLLIIGINIWKRRQTQNAGT
jgi:hypothetical protein